MKKLLLILSGVLAIAGSANANQSKDIWAPGLISLTINNHSAHWVHYTDNYVIPQGKSVKLNMINIGHPHTLNIRINKTDDFSVDDSVLNNVIITPYTGNDGYVRLDETYSGQSASVTCTLKDSPAETTTKISKGNAINCSINAPIILNMHD